jgi:anaerobic ribonucleoside-triphosphate reductase activating protein
MVDGPGLRFVVFAQGCPHACPGCHNPETHNFAGGYDTTVDNVLAAIDENPLLCGVTLSGGEPFAQAGAFAQLARAAHERGLDVFCYSGYAFETLRAGRDWLPLLREVDTLVDGPFLLPEKTLTLPFRGSRNQRLIDVPASLAAEQVVPRTLDAPNVAFDSPHRNRFS